MKLLKNYIQNFKSRSGSTLFLASIAARFLSFLASWIALQNSPNKALGVVLFAYSIIVFVLPVGGFGLHQSLLRFGALLKTNAEKNNLFIAVFRKGVLASLPLITILIGCCYFIPFTFKNAFFYIVFLSLIIIPSYVFELIKIQFRLQHNNKLFAYSEIVQNIFLVFFVTILSFLYQEKGYALALLLTPLCTCLAFFKRLKINYYTYKKPTIINRSFWSYGFFASLANVVTQLLFVIDLLLIGYLLKDAEMVTNYKYISLIPMSLLLLPRVFINADFVFFTENIHKKKYIVNYIKSYVLLFSLLSVLACVFFLFFSKPILNLFDAHFKMYNTAFLILVVGVCGILILRGLFGNLLSSIGKAQVNFYITSIALLINGCSNFYLIPKYGIQGAAITSAAMMWFTGVLSAFAFWWLYNHRFLNKE